MSPIPEFDHNHVLPPHLGNPTAIDDLSPYRSSIMEFCVRFSTSKERVVILLGFLSFRIKMHTHGITQGFQWLDGSFLEDIEKAESRAPNDLDLVTFFGGLSFDDFTNLKERFPEFSDPIMSKTNYRLDHYPFDYTYDPFVTVEYTRYWVQLFTHNRKGVWKGIIHLPIDTYEEDLAALEYLKGLVL